MDWEELHELHYITPIRNIPSILQHGLLSFSKAKKYNPRSLAMTDVQEVRDNKAVPGAKPLHQYVNLYFCARNPMMYKRRQHHREICVLRISPEVLNQPDVVISDGNAASRYTKFLPSPSGLKMIDEALVFADYWTDDDQIEKWRKGRIKCAEVLVPDNVETSFILGAYVSCVQAERELIGMGFSLPVVIDSHLFFQG